MKNDQQLVSDSYLDVELFEFDASFSSIVEAKFVLRTIAEVCCWDVLEIEHWENELLLYVHQSSISQLLV